MTSNISKETTAVFKKKEHIYFALKKYYYLFVCAVKYHSTTSIT